MNGGEKIDVNNNINTNEERIIEFLSLGKEIGYCDDCISYKLNIKPRQQVNQICRILDAKRDINRIKSICKSCNKMKITNFLNENSSDISKITNIKYKVKEDTKENWSYEDEQYMFSVLLYLLYIANNLFLLKK